MSMEEGRIKEKSRLGIWERFSENIRGVTIAHTFSVCLSLSLSPHQPPTSLLQERWEREEKWSRYYCQFTNHLKLEHIKGAILLCALILWVRTSHRAQLHNVGGLGWEDLKMMKGNPSAENGNRKLSCMSGS